MSEVGNLSGLEYLVPRRISQGFEFAPGWGLRQVAALFAGVVLGGLIFFIMFLIHAPIFLRVFPLILGCGAGFLVARPQPDGSTFLDMLAAFMAWRKSQKVFLFDWSWDDW